MSDELKTQAKDARPDYDPPRAVRMDGRSAGRGANCNFTGSGAADFCAGNGNGAGWHCQNTGASADGACGSGNTAAMYCDPGSSGDPL